MLSLYIGQTDQECAINLFRVTDFPEKCTNMQDFSFHLWIHQITIDLRVRNLKVGGRKYLFLFVFLKALYVLLWVKDQFCISVWWMGACPEAVGPKCYSRRISFSIFLNTRGKMSTDRGCMCGRVGFFTPLSLSLLLFPLRKTVLY